MVKTYDPRNTVCATEMETLLYYAKKVDSSVKEIVMEHGRYGLGINILIIREGKKDLRIKIEYYSLISNFTSDRNFKVISEAIRDNLLEDLP